MTPEEIRNLEASSKAFKAAARPLVKKMIEALGLSTAIRKDTGISHHVESKPCLVHGTMVKIEACRYAKISGGPSNKINVEVTIGLPEDGVIAQAYMDHVAAAEGTKKNHCGDYAAGPRYRTYDAERHNKRVEAYSPWNNRFLVVKAKDYTVDQLDEAARDTLLLAAPIVAHLADLPGLRFWTGDDAEVLEKAQEIIHNADLRDDHVDYETRSHWLEDRNSFFKGWFNPWNDRGRGTFDTLWPSSVKYAASAMGIEGSFEYAVACVLLEDEEFKAKAREACVIREETKTIMY